MTFLLASIKRKQTTTTHSLDLPYGHTTSDLHGTPPLSTCYPVPPIHIIPFLPFMSPVTLIELFTRSGWAVNHSCTLVTKNKGVCARLFPLMFISRLSLGNFFSSLFFLPFSTPALRRFRSVTMESLSVVHSPNLPSSEPHLPTSC
jgi:hypothetical protein